MLEPQFGGIDLVEAEALLSGLAAVDRVQIARGWPPVSEALRRRWLRYVRRDPAEEWLTIRELWARGGGDCEDLAAAVAAELQVAGVDAHPIIYRVRPGLAHAVVRLPDGRIIDPSTTGGMRAP